MQIKLIKQKRLEKNKVIQDKEKQDIGKVETQDMPKKDGKQGA